MRTVDKQTHAYSFCAAGAAALVVWKCAPRVEHVIGLLQELRPVALASRAGVLLVIFIPDVVAPPLPNARDGLRATLPALLDCCRDLLVVVEGERADRYLVRSLFHTLDAAKAPHFVPSIGEALALAQAVFPEDVLALKRLIRYPMRAREPWC